MVVACGYVDAIVLLVEVVLLVVTKGDNFGVRFQGRVHARDAVFPVDNFRLIWDCNHVCALRANGDGNFLRDSNASLFL